MHIVRQEQMEALRQDRLCTIVMPLMLERLQAAEILPPAKEALGSENALDTEEDAGEDAPEHQTDLDEEVERPSLEILQAEILSDLRQALRLGIETDDGLLQFVSYRYLLGSEWQAIPEVAALLAPTPMSEEARLRALHLLLTTG